MIGTSNLRSYLPLKSLMPLIHTLSPGHVTKLFTDTLTDPVPKILTIVSCKYEQWIRGHYFYFSGSVEALLAVYKLLHVYDTQL